MIEQSYKAPRVSKNVKLLGRHNYTDDLVHLFKSIEEEIPWSDTFPTYQSGIQCSEDRPEDLLASCGSGRDLKVPEHEFKILAARYKNTVIEKILESVSCQIWRMRWMKLQFKSCYSVHKDPTPRIHIPVVTNENCCFLFPEEGLVHLEAGGIYLVDTTKFHTFINGGTDNRIHLVAGTE